MLSYLSRFISDKPLLKIELFIFEIIATKIPRATYVAPRRQLLAACPRPEGAASPPHTVHPHSEGAALAPLPAASLSA